MRTRKRLIEVLETVNEHAIGGTTAFNLITAASCLQVPGHCPDCASDMARIIQRHESPHIRALATEALHYFHNEDAQ